MFTGLTEEKGTVEEIRRVSMGARLKVRAAFADGGVKLGDSIAVNGVCLTADELDKGSFCAYVMAETLRRTNLGGLSRGSAVNLERAMPADGRFGGHIVAGHIDACGTVTKRFNEGGAVWIYVTAPPQVMRYIAEKGSIAVDGVSLTAAETGADYFAVSLIPHTLSETTLLDKRPGDRVNLENDIIAKYVERFVTGKNEALSEEKLREYGF